MQSNRGCGIRCMSADLAGAGGDLCSVSLIENYEGESWVLSRLEYWNEPDTDITRGKIISLYSKYRPDLVILDADGLGYPIYVSIKKVLPKVIKFNGAGMSRRNEALNARADGYLTLKEFVDAGRIKIPYQEVIRQLEYIKKQYKSSGRICIQSKREIKAEQGESPDFADSLMMAVYAVNYYSYMIYEEGIDAGIESDFDPFSA